MAKDVDQNDPLRNEIHVMGLVRRNLEKLSRSARNRVLNHLAEHYQEVDEDQQERLDLDEE